MGTAVMSDCFRYCLEKLNNYTEYPCLIPQAGVFFYHNDIALGANL